MNIEYLCTIKKITHMAILRFKALEEVLKRQPLSVQLPNVPVSDYFAMNVFDRPKMKKYLSKEAFESVVMAMDHGLKIDRKMADQVASGMKAWAIEKGASHYTHWFHPLTDSTAEKHDGFFETNFDGDKLEVFDGDKLVQQEPDASSFPSGGIRSTFEARGYTAWDPSSPAFMVGQTLCIPTIFVSYTGEALDYKAPLLNAVSVLDKAAAAVCQYFDKDITKVHSTLGWEQEYFLVDDALYNARPDLILAERTLMGHASAKNQQLEDHYFGAIPDRVVAFMQEFEIESFKLGIPLKTRHNEVAPNQFEVAPIFEEISLANDHNLLVMDVMRRVARKHNFRVLFHEKPFKGVNGSAKHNNWSMATNTGVNLLKPGKNPKSNMMFLTFLANVVKAVFDHADLLRASIVSAGNEHRLGANEAPPAIVSVFLGTHVSAMLDEIVTKVSNKPLTPDQKTELKLNIGKIPEILMDNTDRNRTSPFAFTGNRFEFRAVGASANSAAPMIALQTAVADQLLKFKAEVDELIEKDVKKDDAIFQVLRRIILDSKAIRFEGNGYSKEWAEEAERRGLTNIKEAQEALKAYISEKTLKLFEENGVMTERESHARYEVRLEKFKKQLQIESRVLGDLAINHIIPTAIQYQNLLINNVEGMMDIFEKAEAKSLAKTQIDTIKAISLHVKEIVEKCEEMRLARKDANELEDCEEASQAYARKVKPYLETIREHIDSLELIVDDELWPLPKYRELLFVR